MRKSERLRLAELQIAKLEFELELLKSIVFNLVESAGNQEMDSGKWYVRKPSKND